MRSSEAEYPSGPIGHGAVSEYFTQSMRFCLASVSSMRSPAWLSLPEKFPKISGNFPYFVVKSATLRHTTAYAPGAICVLGGNGNLMPFVNDQLERSTAV